MKEQKVDAIPLVADAQTPLAGNERELASEFQKEFFDLRIKASSKAFSEYSSFNPRNSSTSGSLISCSGVNSSAESGA